MPSFFFHVKNAQVARNGFVDTIPFICSKTTYIFKVSNRDASLFLSKACLGKYLFKVNNKAIKQ